MLVFGVGQGSKGPGGERAGAGVKGVAKLPAFGALCGLGGGEHLLHLAVMGEEADRRKKEVCVPWGHSNDHRGSGPLALGLGFWVKETR